MTKIHRIGLATLLPASLCVLALAAAPASAAFGVAPDPSDPSRPDFHVAVLDTDGVTPFTQAAGHPFEMVTSFNLNLTPDGLFPDGRAKDVQVDLPAGFVGDPTATATCDFNDLRNSGQCPVQSQIGVAALRFSLGFGPLEFFAPLYNMTPAPGDVATFSFNVLNVLTAVHVRVRSEGDYGVRAFVHNPSSYLPLTGSTLTLWGVPADPSHDALRGSCLNGDGTSNGSCPAQTPPRPFLTNPADCSASPQPAKLSLDAYEDPADVKTYASTPLPAVTGCEQLSFEGSLTFRPASRQAGVPTAATVHLHLLQNGSAVGVGAPPLRDATVTLPAGVVISPPSANGLRACTDAQLAVASAAPAACPRASRIGTVRVDSPVLPVPLLGRIYLGQPLPGQTFRIFLEAFGQGVRVKLRGKVDPDARSGRITTTFGDNPQLPFSDLELSFDGGPHAALANPRACGTYVTRSQLTPYGAPATPAVTTSDDFLVTSGLDGGACGPAGFSPSFAAGTRAPIAGRSSDFTLTFARQDRDQLLAAIALRLPQGLTGRIANVRTLCPSAQAAQGTCADGSRIGSVHAGAGPGTDPLFLPGQVYLTGPYKGAPFGLSVVVPAVAGPFDLGTVAVRSAVFVDRHTAAIRIVSDPLPSILDGVPLQVRVVNVDVDRRGFMLNPTSCAAKRIAGRISSAEGRTAAVGSRFRVTNCAALPFRPRLRLAVGGRGHTARHASTPLTATLVQTPGQAHLRTVSVKLPSMLNARLDVVNRACTQAQFDAGRCEGARAGSAAAVTPLLARPLRGGVYFVKDPHKPPGSLPNLVVALRGEVAFDLVGKLKIPHGTRLSTRFVVPDVPVRRFSLRLTAGPNGPLGNAEDLCTATSARARAAITFRGQNGVVLHRSQRLAIHGCRRRHGAR